VAEIALVLVLLSAVALFATVARRAGIPYPILMVLGGVLLGIVANALRLPSPRVDPEFVFLLFLPPVLFAAAYFTSIRDFRANLRPIALLAVGLVVVTTISVAVVAHLVVPELGWAGAFVLGAIVSPPDAVATTAIMRRLHVPRRLVTILEGESLVNDATALVLYRLAVGAVASGTFSLLEAGRDFVLVGIGGILVGAVIIAIAVFVLERLEDPPVEITISFLIPVTAYLAAELLHVSGVLATVTAGLVMGQRASRIMSSDTRVLGFATWSMAIFVINGLVFTLLGLQLPGVLDALSGRPVGEIALAAVAVSLTVIAIRIAWVYPATYIPRWLSAALQARDPAPPPRVPFVIGWAGLRGIVSLAAALALPFGIEGGRPFPERELIIFLTFAVILATLVGQGLTLPFVVRALRISSDPTGGREERTARVAAAEAASRRIDELAAEWPGHLPLIDNLRSMYEHRLEHLPGDGEVEEALDQELVEHKRIRRAVIEAQRDAIIGLRDDGTISDEVLRRVERDLDLEELRMEA
jgi:CPA1 family monovalent cation:H+ antiporter